MRWKAVVLEYGLFLLIAIAVCSSWVGCGNQAKEQEVTKEVINKREVEEIAAPVDQPLEDYQVELLDLAFNSVSKMPIEIHIKNRSRAQQHVVETCLKMKQPARALDYAEQIENWRKNLCYAHLACHFAGQGDEKTANHYIELAKDYPEETTDWRRDRIKVTIAKAHTWLGEKQKASDMETGVEDSETGKVAGVKAMVAGEDTFNKQLEDLKAVLKIGDFSASQNALWSLTSLFDRYYENEERRSAVEKMIREEWKAVPKLVRFDLLEEMTKIALKHAGQEKAKELVDQMHYLVSSNRWSFEHQIPMVARVLKLRHKAGDVEGVREEAEAILDRYETDKKLIPKVFRAESLRPMAEAFHKMGQRELADSIYRLVIEEGANNPNSRPKSVDLSETCCSMALNKYEPDAELWARLREINEGLGDPW
jgi:hypothetical protein